MKKINWWLMAVFVLSFGLSVTSCKDDDDEKSEQKKGDVSPLDTDEARVAFRWLCALTDVTTLDDNWKSKTYEPTVGVASENDQFTRLIVVSSLDEAKEDFSRLADMEVSQLSTAQTVNGGAAGTMTWTPSKTGAQNLAVVTVSSRIMPHLQKMVYCTDEQTGLNGLLWDSMKGVAYYRLGDVIRDAQGYYWVCVRPSFAPDKADSHWMNIYNASPSGNINNEKKPMLTENVYSSYNNVDKYNRQTILLPTKLSYDRKHIYNLSNLIWALLNPGAYRNACLDLGNKGLGLCGFEYTYHGVTFLNAVANFWDQVWRDNQAQNEYTIWERLFGLTHEQMRTLRQMNFYYQGYKWWWGNTPDFWVYKSTGYVKTYGETGSESKDKVSDYDVVTNGFDIKRYTGDPEAAKVGPEQFTKQGDDVTGGAWVIRYKSGDQLCTTGRYDPHNRIGGCTDVYVYNRAKQVFTGEGDEQETEETFYKPMPELYPITGSILASDGECYKTALAAIGAGATPVAIVLCYEGGEKIMVEYGDNYRAYHGLAMALNDVPVSAWAASDRYGICGNHYIGEEDFIEAEALNGMYLTEKMALSCSRNHNHPVAKACRNYTVEGLTDDMKKAYGWSQWFMPSIGQFIKGLLEVSYMDGDYSKLIEWDENYDRFVVGDSDGHNYTVLKNFLKASNVEKAMLNGTYWTASESSETCAYTLTFAENQRFRISESGADSSNKTREYKARPFIAIK